MAAQSDGASNMRINEMNVCVWGWRDEEYEEEKEKEEEMGCEWCERKLTEQPVD